MRCTQFVGLSPEAVALILEVTDPICSVCKQGGSKHLKEVPSSRSRYAYGMYDEAIPLGDYVLKTGEPCFEEVQASPWSSGPVIFTALKDKNGNWIKESLHPEEEINNA